MENFFKNESLSFSNNKAFDGHQDDSIENQKAIDLKSSTYQSIKSNQCINLPPSSNDKVHGLIKCKTPLNFGSLKHDDHSKAYYQTKTPFIFENDENINEISKRVIKSQNEAKRRKMTKPSYHNDKKTDEKDTLNFLENLIANSNRPKTTIE